MTDFSFEGVEQLDASPLKACLITHEREDFDLQLGIGDPSCGKPPFDRSAPTLRLWRWPWTEWPTFNQAIFDRDLQRVVRWYRARGYYDAKVKEVRYDPPQAEHPGFKGTCDPNTEKCLVSLVVVLDEGHPTRVRSVELKSTSDLPAALERQAREQLGLQPGAALDETRYEQDRAGLRKLLRAAGYAAARVEGRVEVDTQARQAQVVYRIEPGPIYRFGQLTISGHGSLSEQVIRAAAALPSAELYDPEVLAEMHTEVFALGAFSSIEVRETLNEKEERVDVELVVTPLAPHALRLGVGVTSGAMRRTETADLVSIPQWDVHLFGSYERRHLFGTLGRLTIEERPRLIFNRDFPRFTQPRLGNLFTVGLNQPGLLEARTDTFERVGWDYGPDPFLGFFRSDLYFRLGVRRGFLGRRLVATVAAQQDRFVVSDAPGTQTTDGSPLPSSYGYSYLEQDLRLDLRDDRARATRGIYAGLNASQAPRWSASDWTAFRLAPELRTYLRLPLDVVWATRFAIAGFFITSASAALDELSQELGPNAYRLRGGGAYSNRGFLAGTLGAGLQGGVRRWETSTELRVPLGNSFVIAGFLDLGDVNDAPQFRFHHLNTTLGYGVRYYTVLGAIRLDLGHRLLNLQRVDGTAGVEADDSRLPFSQVPGAIHLTIGDPF